MNHREVALEVIEAFCRGEVAAMRGRLAEGLRFSGPFLRTEDREAYLAALDADPPQETPFEVIDVLEGEGTVCVLYEYGRPSGPLTIAQHFRFEGGAVVEMRLVFDSKDVK